MTSVTTTKICALKSVAITVSSFIVWGLQCVLLYYMKNRVCLFCD